MKPREDLPEYELFDANTQAIVFNHHPAAIQRMLDYDFACRRETPSVAAIVSTTSSGYYKCFWGSREIRIPFYRSIEAAAQVHPNADVLANFASFRSAFEPSMQALNTPSIRTIAIIAEGIPERYARELHAVAKQKHKWIIGPATVGAIKPGCFKIGNTGGTTENIVQSQMHVPGFVGFTSKSGGMSNELYNMLALFCGPVVGAGQTYPALYEGVAIGGDRFPGSSMCDHILRFEANPQIKMLVALGEVGGDNEYRIIEALEAGKITKPLVIWVMGTCAKLFPGEVQFGHAGARADSDRETADAKNSALRSAGALVPNSYDDFADRIHDVYMDLLQRKQIAPIPVPEPVTIPIELKAAEQSGIVRRSTNFVSSISDDRGEELKYAGVEISRVVEEGFGLGGTIGLLWFKRELPDFARTFIDMILVSVADHGPAVSGAHNAIVASRAGKDLVSSVASGLLTIGPRFGGAIDDAVDWSPRRTEVRLVDKRGSLAYTIFNDSFEHLEHEPGTG